jgi:hypothetical protein
VLGAGIRGSTLHVPVGIGAGRVAVGSRRRAHARVATLCTTVIVLAGVSVWARSEAPEPRREITELAGVKLGMTPLEVVAALGQPTLVDRRREAVPAAGKPKRDTAFGYVYSKADKPEYSLQLVFYNREAPWLGVVCEVNAESSALGLANGTKERQVLRALGKPGNISISFDRVQKIISYPQWKVAYVIQKRRVVGVCVSSRGIVTFLDSA